MKFLNSLRTKIAAFRSAKSDEASRRETLAMVYGGDIYAVLVRDRAARQLASIDRRRADHRQEAGWPFIR